MGRLTFEQQVQAGTVELARMCQDEEFKRKTTQLTTALHAAIGPLGGCSYGSLVVACDALLRTWAEGECDERLHAVLMAVRHGLAVVALPTAGPTKPDEPVH